MIRYILDTDHISLWQRGDVEVIENLRRVLPQEAGIYVVSVEEQINGRFAQMRKAQTKQDTATAYLYLTQTLTLLKALPLLTFSEAAIERYELLKAQKLNVKSNDLRIAAIALEQKATLVTRNRRDFERVPTLTIEDWAQK